ncbi:uncharacterized protein [Polyergus mexicanus]|uniref:uncharacterized protein isoform X2 n=1 Tax=Polyergus mexicanus TaxID=615972 RepID=UPI0038B5B5A2
MYSKSCCALFLLALVACQAAPSPKIIEKSTETASKLVKEDIKLEDTGADKDRAKKSTTFCVEVRSGKEELVPCKQELPIKQTQQVLDLKTPEYKPMTIMQTASVPASVQYPVQYPVSNIMMQQPMPQLSPISLLQPPSQVVVSAQPQQQVPEPITHQHVIHVQTQPQQTSAPVSQVQSQQSAFSAPAPAPAPTPIINIIPAPASAPCEKPSVMQPQPIPPQQVHTVHVVQPTQQAPLLPKQEVKPIKMEQEKPQILPISHQGLSVLTPVARPCKTEMLLPSSPVELVYHEEEPTRLVEYVPTVQEELYECSCRSEQQKAKPYKHHVTLHPSGSKSFRSPMMTLQYNPSIGENVESPVIAQTREMV